MPLPLFQAKKPLPPPNPLENIGAVVGIAAGKGGVGKSTVTVNLALALKEKGYRVGIMDTDIYGPSIRKMLPEEQLPSQKGAIIQPALCKGIKMISMSFFRKVNEATAVRAPIANGLITQFIQNVEWGVLDYLLIDFPPGTGDVQITLSQKAHLLGALMVTTPQEVALLDVRKAISLFDQVNVPLVGVVENMSYFQTKGEAYYPFGKGGGQKLAAERGVPLLGELPLDTLLCACGDKGESLFDCYPEAPIAQAYHRFAELFIAQITHMKAENKGLRSFEMKWVEK